MIKPSPSRLTTNSAFQLCGSALTFIAR